MKDFAPAINTSINWRWIICTRRWNILLYLWNNLTSLRPFNFTFFTQSSFGACMGLFRGLLKAWGERQTCRQSDGQHTHVPIGELHGIRDHSHQTETGTDRRLPACLPGLLAGEPQLYVLMADDNTWNTEGQKDKNKAKIQPGFVQNQSFPLKDTLTCIAFPFWSSGTMLNNIRAAALNLNLTKGLNLPLFFIYLFFIHHWSVSAKVPSLYLQTAFWFTVLVREWADRKHKPSSCSDACTCRFYFKNRNCPKVSIWLASRMDNPEF